MSVGRSEVVRVISICCPGQKGVKSNINMANVAIVVMKFTDYDEDLSARLPGRVLNILA